MFSFFVNLLLVSAVTITSATKFDTADEINVRVLIPAAYVTYPLLKWVTYSIITADYLE